MLTAHTRAAVRVPAVAQAKYVCVRETLREQVAQPVDAVARRPRLLEVPVQPSSKPMRKPMRKVCLKTEEQGGYNMLKLL